MKNIINILWLFCWAIFFAIAVVSYILFIEMVKVNPEKNYFSSLSIFSVTAASFFITLPLFLLSRRSDMKYINWPFEITDLKQTKSTVNLILVFTCLITNLINVTILIAIYFDK